MSHEKTYDLTWNQYGKAEVRVVHVDRSGPQHVVRDLNVTTGLRGDFEPAYTEGDNSRVLTTDAQKNTVFGLARETGVGEPEAFALAVARQLLSACPSADVARVVVEQYLWNPLSGGGGHAFSRAGSHVVVAELELNRDGAAELTGGVDELVVLKTTDSEYSGFLKERFTTLGETDERILATQVTARWRYAEGAAEGADHAAVKAGALEALLGAFAGHYSLALQQTLHAMGVAVLEACPELAEVTLTLPNKHHFLQDLSAYGLDNPNAVYHADDRPYGLIQGTITRR
ncbi:urate oxidase [Quadrisphaera granulorum]|uniref:Uricase n=1 Tax=Quadrisphaera granulorum TaxID=317664 RepID=A0A316A5F6_9ACTN|nr:urate oxidase [Quadrisphaera granulorum]PWJ52925.1 urate oxidase [Quadrisphaera granulorum]SZE97307.1 urate oxidase [Quadrisphaera granulorum]